VVPQARERCQSAHYLSEHHNATPPPANSSGWTSVWTLKRIIGMSPEWGGGVSSHLKRLTNPL